MSLHTIFLLNFFKIFPEKLIASMYKRRNWQKTREKLYNVLILYMRVCMFSNICLSWQEWQACLLEFGEKNHAISSLLK